MGTCIFRDLKKGIGLENLSLVEGLPREAIEAKLREAKIDYYPVSTEEKLKGTPFFRSCYIDIVTKIIPGDGWEHIGWERIREILGRPDYPSGSYYHYYAKYEMLPKFDMSKLNGKLTFDHGLLVESTIVSGFKGEPPLPPIKKY
jgi:hypothetical protein